MGHGHKNPEGMAGIPTFRLVNELAKREGVREHTVTPHQPYAVCVGLKMDMTTYHLTHEDTGAARILVVID